VDPARLVREALTHTSISTPARLYVLAVGKAAWPMAHAFAQSHGQAIQRGVIAGPVDRRTAGQVPHAFEYFDAGHPMPNEASVAAGQRALELARLAGRTDDGQLVVLLSGGASALMVAPSEGVTLEDKVDTGRVLMRAGAAIGPLNCVRKHLSDVKGGRLGAAAGRSITLAISDVHGPIPDDPSVIGSGPTVADPTTFADALAIVREVAGVPQRVRDRLERGAAGDLIETIKPGDRRLARSTYAIIGNRVTALEGAKTAAEASGYIVVTIDRVIDGESRVAGRELVEHARRAAAGASRPLCILGAGETTVTVKGDGLGGRNQELVLAAVPALADLGRPAVLASVGTDGVDGPTDAAGAIADSTTSERARRLGLDWESTLARNDAYHFFQPLGDLVRWGPTGTNVGDVQVLLI
jgi:glycerate 2-kinase